MYSHPQRIFGNANHARYFRVFHAFQHQQDDQFVRFPQLPDTAVHLMKPFLRHRIILLFSYLRQFMQRDFLLHEMFSRVQQTAVDRYPVDPGTYRRFISETIQVLPDFDEYFLYSIVGGFFLPFEIPHAQSEDLRIVFLVDCGELFFFGHAIARFRLFATRAIAADRT